MKQRPKTTSHLTPAMPAATPHRSPGVLRSFGLLAAGWLLLSGTLGWAATRTWTNSVSDLNWSTAVNWSANSVPGLLDTAQFLTNGAAPTPGGVSCIVDANATIKSLYFANTNSRVAHNVRIADGVTLAITNTTTGYAIWAHANDAAITPDGTQLTNIISGPKGSIVINSPEYPGAFMAAYAGGTDVREILDMSDLGTFTAYLSRFYVAPTGGGSSGLNRESGTIKLARTNLIYSSWTGAGGRGILIGFNNNASAPGGTLELGQTNVLLSDLGMDVGMRRATDSRLCFNPSFANPYAYFRNRTGGRQASWWIGSAEEINYSSGGYAQGTVDFSGGTVDALVDQLVIGRSGLALTRNTGGRGVLTCTTGVINANTITNGDQLVDSGPPASGQINVGGTAELIVNGFWQLGRFMYPDIAEGASSAVLNIGTVGGGGGAVKAYGGIITTRDPWNPASYSEVHVVTNGSLYVRGTVGPLDVLELDQCTLTLDYGVTAPDPMTPVCTTAALRTGSPTTVNVLGTAFGPGQFPLIKYETLASGNGFSDLTFTLPGVVRGYVSNNLANSSVDLVITEVLGATWAGRANGVDNGNWDIGMTANWVDQFGAACTYQQPSLPGAAVKFDDTAPGTPTVDLKAASLSPASITVNNSALNYTFTGSGGLTGVASLTKDGSGTLTVANAGVNDFSGPIALNAGTLRLGGSANRLPTNGRVSLADGSDVVLDLNNQNQMLGSIAGGGGYGGDIHLGSATLTLAGGGATYGGVISGSGKLVKTNVGVSATQVLTGANTYSGGTLISGPTTLVVANTSGSGLGSGNVTIENNGTLAIGNGESGSIAAAAIVNNGTLSLNVNTPDVSFDAVISGSGAVTKDNAGSLVRFGTANSYAGPTTILNGQLRVSNGAALGAAQGNTTIGAPAGARLELEGDITTAEPISFASKHDVASCGILNVSGSNTLTGAITLGSGGSTLPQDWGFRSDGGTLVMRGPITVPGGDNRHYMLRGNGDGEVYGGFPSAGANNGLYKYDAGTWTLWGTNVHAGMTTVRGGMLVVNGAIRNSAGVLLLGGNLCGSGYIACAVTNDSGSTLSPGVAVGTLTISNRLELLPGSTTRFDVSASGCDLLRGLSSVTYGGTLQVVIEGGVSANRVLKLFEATSYTGAFDYIEVPALPAPLAWDPSYLAIDGTLRVIGGPEVASCARRSDGNFQLSGTGTAGWTYRILSTTNLNQPLSAWVELSSGTFPDDGTFSFSHLSATNYPQRFYRVVSP